MHSAQRFDSLGHKERDMLAAMFRNTSVMVRLSLLVLGGVFALQAYAADTEQVTFSNQVVRIFQEKCQDCHRAGTAAPMSLVTFQEARPWAKSIKERVLS